MRTPNFLFIGADRCGSKWLHRILALHPDCFVPEIADPYFFDRNENYGRGFGWYLKLFAAAPASAVAVGELSHDYIHSNTAASRIAEHLPAVKLVATLRHPVERAFSSFASAYNAGTIKLSFEQALNDVEMLIENSLYADKLETYFNLFGRKRLKVMLYDKLQCDPRGYAEEIFDFLDLRRVDGLPYGDTFNRLSPPRTKWSGTASKAAANTLRRVGLPRVLGVAKRSPLVRSIFYGKYAAGEAPRIDPDTRRLLLDRFEPEIGRLELLLGMDLSAWRH